LGEDNYTSFAQEGLLHKEQGVKISEK